jgi:hypothetical protein
MNTHIVEALKSIAKLAETSWTKRKNPVLKKLVDELVNIAECIAPTADQHEDRSDFQNYLSDLSTTIEEIENLYVEIDMADTPQETTAAVQHLDEQLSLTVELLSKLVPISQIIDTSVEDLRAKWLPNVILMATLPDEERADHYASLLLAPLTAREASVIRELIREQITQTLDEKK